MLLNYEIAQLRLKEGGVVGRRWKQPPGSDLIPADNPVGVGVN